ncbi:MAG: type II toxin-antitoxin system VapC family toxin [Armatimonadota bacterium]
MSVYIDTSAFYAIIDATDGNHQRAVSCWRNILQQGESLVTSSYVVTEIVALLHNRFGTDVVRRFVDDDLPVVDIYWADASIHDSAIRAMLTFRGKRGPSLTDCAGLEIVRLLGIQQVFAYDRHFENHGVGLVGE